MSSSVSSLGVMVQPAALLRLLCALMVALVTVFHVCGTASAREIGPVVVFLDVTGDDGSADDVGMTMEQCHFCSVVPLLATASATVLPYEPHLVPAAVTAGLLPFCPRAASPPPRALT